MWFKGLTPFNEICFSCFNTYTVTIRFNEFKRNKLHVSSAVIVTQKMSGYCGGLRAVSLFVNRSAMFVEAVFKSTFGFSYVLFVTVKYWKKYIPILFNQPCLFSCTLKVAELIVFCSSGSFYACLLRQERYYFLSSFSSE